MTATDLGGLVVGEFARERREVRTGRNLGLHLLRERERLRFAARFGEYEYVRRIPLFREEELLLVDQVSLSRLGQIVRSLGIEFGPGERLDVLALGFGQHLVGLERHSALNHRIAVEPRLAGFRSKGLPEHHVVEQVRDALGIGRKSRAILCGQPLQLGFVVGPGKLHRRIFGQNVVGRPFSKGGGAFAPANVRATTRLARTGFMRPRKETETSQRDIGFAL